MNVILAIFVKNPQNLSQQSALVAKSISPVILVIQAFTTGLLNSQWKELYVITKHAEREYALSLTV